MDNDLISRSALKEEIRRKVEENRIGVFVAKSIFKLIDNATTVCGNNPKWCESCVSKGKCASTRPQGECKSCRHRDPEDKKCDCGGQERQGCPFPVSDDYYCKYYERGEEND